MPVPRFAFKHRLIIAAAVLGMLTTAAWAQEPRSAESAKLAGNAPGPDLELYPAGFALPEPGWALHASARGRAQPCEHGAD
jgi:hypothetical protein